MRQSVQQKKLALVNIDGVELQTVVEEAKDA